MSKPTPLSADQINECGISSNAERMANGELRFRLNANDGSGYIRTVASSEGGWQNSHYHNAVMETYIVQFGWIALAELHGNSLTVFILDQSNSYTTRPGVPHNVYMPANAIIHTVKHGPPTNSADWFSSQELDSQTKHLDEDGIKRLATIAW